MTTETQPDVRLSMPAKPEGVGVVRQAVAGVADALDLDDAVLADVKMAVTEACTNVVVHAYDDGTDGLLEVDIIAGEDALTVVVRDYGSGIQPRAVRTEPPALGLGLPLIAALTDAFELRGGGAGTEVRMNFAYERTHDPAQENPILGGPQRGTWATGESSRRSDQAARRSASSSLMRPRRPRALDSIWRTRSGVIPSWRPISRSGVGASPSIP